MVDILEIDADNDNISAFLESYLQSGNLNFLIGSGASFPAIKTAGDIEKQINDLLSAGDEEGASRKCLEFIEQIVDAHAKISKDPAEVAVQNVLSNYVRFISVIDRLLFARKNILLPRQVTIFTTNYDMFLEYAAGLVPGVILNDGFDRSSSINSEFMFTPERYFDRTYRSGPVYGHRIEIPTVNLVKLHGSLSWRKKSDTVVFDPAAIPSLSAKQRAKISHVNAYLEKHFLILPNLKKYHSTLMERVYYDLLRLFSKAMDQENAVLMGFGFSFADEHILDITRRALRNPTSQLIIFSYDNATSTAYKAKFSGQRNVTIIAPPVGSVIDFTRLNSVLTSILSGPHDAE